MFEFCIRYRYRLNLTLNVCFVWTLFVFDIPSLSLSLQFQSIHFAVYLARVCAASLHLHSVTVLTSLLSLIFFFSTANHRHTLKQIIYYILHVNWCTTNQLIDFLSSCFSIPNIYAQHLHSTAIDYIQFAKPFATL